MSSKHVAAAPEAELEDILQLAGFGGDISGSCRRKEELAGWLVGVQTKSLGQLPQGCTTISRWRALKGKVTGDDGRVQEPDNVRRITVGEGRLKWDQQLQP